MRTSSSLIEFLPSLRRILSKNVSNKIKIFGNQLSPLIDFPNAKRSLKGCYLWEKSVGEKSGLGFLNEQTHTSSKTVIVKGITNPSTPQAGTSSKFVRNGKGRNSNNKV